jgi:hypothetical protein
VAGVLQQQRVAIEQQNCQACTTWECSIARYDLLWMLGWVVSHSVLQQQEPLHAYPRFNWL